MTAPERRARVACLVGTRPEAVKMAPVIAALRERAAIETRIVASGQHGDLVRPTLAEFGLAADVDLGTMRPRQGLADLTGRLLRRFDRWLGDEGPDLVVAQGDTTTVLAAALASFYRGLPFAHVEAGLRSFDLGQPFPEEANRQLIARVARLHFAPLDSNREHLEREGVPAERIHVTGNPVVDALRATIARRPDPPVDLPAAGRLLLVTAHRRESHGSRLAALAAALRRLLDEDASLVAFVPLHPNPAASAPLRRMLAGHPRARLRPPLAYGELVATLARATLVITDSGGLQEEAPALGVPTIVLRERTERPEAVAANAARLVGRDGERMLAAAREILGDEELRRAMASTGSLFGDGHAAPRIAAIVARFLRGADGAE